MTQHDDLLAYFRERPIGTPIGRDIIAMDTGISMDSISSVTSQLVQEGYLDNHKVSDDLQPGVYRLRRDHLHPTPRVRVVNEQRLAQIVEDVTSELRSAVAANGRMHSAHEGWAVLREEEEELWDEVKRRITDPKAMRREAVQVAAMALRFLHDVCDG